MILGDTTSRLYIRFGDAHVSINHVVGESSSWLRTPAKTRSRWMRPVLSITSFCRAMLDVVEKRSHHEKTGSFTLWWLTTWLLHPLIKDLKRFFRDYYPFTGEHEGWQQNFSRRRTTKSGIKVHSYLFFTLLNQEPEGSPMPLVPRPRQYMTPSSKVSRDSASAVVRGGFHSILNDDTLVLHLNSNSILVLSCLWPWPPPVSSDSNLLHGSWRSKICRTEHRQLWLGHFWVFVMMVVYFSETFPAD